MRLVRRCDHAEEAARACSKSAQRSSGCSSPTETRMLPSPMPAALSPGRVQLPVGGGGGVQHQGLHAAQRRRHRGQPQRGDEPQARLAPAGHVEGHHAAVTGQQAAGDRVIGMAGQAGPVHGGHGGVGHEAFGQEGGVRAVAGHPQGQGLQAADGEPGGERVRGHPEIDRALPQRAVHLAAGRHDQPEGDVVVAPQVLGGGMDDDVGAVLDRPAQHRRGEGVVHDAGQPGRAAGGEQCGQVADGDRGIGDRLQEEQP